MRLWHVLLRRRGIVPAPLFYLAAAALGIALGPAVRRAFGRPRWLPLLPLAIWLLSVASIWSKRGGHPTTLRREFLTAIDPVRGMRATHREEHERIRASGLPLFEIENWPGAGALAGWSESPADGFGHVALAFFDSPEGAPVVTIATVANGRAEEEGARGRVQSEMVDLLLNARFEIPATPEASHARFEAAIRRVDELDWEPTTIRVDGRDLDGWRIAADGRSVAYAAVGEHWVVLAATTPDVHYPLSTVSDPDRYLELAAPRGAT